MEVLATDELDLEVLVIDELGLVLATDELEVEDRAAEELELELLATDELELEDLTAEELELEDLVTDDDDELTTAPPLPYVLNDAMVQNAFANDAGFSATKRLHMSMLLRGLPCASLYLGQLD